MVWGLQLGPEPCPRGMEDVGSWLLPINVRAVKCIGVKMYIKGCPLWWWTNHLSNCIFLADQIYVHVSISRYLQSRKACTMILFVDLRWTNGYRPNYIQFTVQILQHSHNNTLAHTVYIIYVLKVIYLLFYLSFMGKCNIISQMLPMLVEFCLF